MSDIAGWSFSNANDVEWQPIGDGVAMKTLSVADGKVIGLFKFEPGYSGGTHHHEDAEFGYVLDGDVIANGVPMTAGGAYGAQAGTDHTEFRTEGGCTVVSVFKAPS